MVGLLESAQGDRMRAFVTAALGAAHAVISTAIIAPVAGRGFHRA